MTKWEYKVLDISNDVHAYSIQEELNKLGKLGYEVVAISGDFIYLKKRYL